MLNVMTYDMHGSWDSYTAHNSPLYSHAGEKPDDLKLNVVSIGLCFSLPIENQKGRSSARKNSYYRDERNRPVFLTSVL